MTSTGIAAPPDTQTLQRRRVGLAGVVEHRRVHRRHALEHRHAVALDDLQRAAGVEARQQRQRPADGDRRVQRTGLAEGVEQRQCTERDRVGVEVEQADRGRDVADQVGVRELRALRRAGRAGGVEQDGGVARLAVGDVVVGCKGRVVGVGGEDDLGAGVGQVVVDLALLEQRVHRDDRGAGAERAVVGDRELGDVRGHQPDAVAGLDALALEQRRHARGGVVEFGVGERAVVEPDRDAVGAGQEFSQVHGLRPHLKAPTPVMSRPTISACMVSVPS